MNNNRSGKDKRKEEKMRETTGERMKR